MKFFFSKSNAMNVLTKRNHTKRTLRH